jgi:ketosteroid isomerase-like protein
MALPKTFTGGERLFAGDLNDNFEDLDTRTSTVESEYVASPTVRDVVVLTQATYDGLSPDASTLYVIVG